MATTRPAFFPSVDPERAEQAWTQHWFMSEPTADYMQAREFFMIGWERALNGPA